jgi:hypothetical protein
MIVAHTIYGDVYAQEPPGFWDEPEIEGHIFYKGFRAAYYRGDEEDNEQDLYFGKIDNIHNAGFCLEGDNLKELTDDFHEAVDDFLMEVDTGGYGGHPIEYYTNDPDLLSYYRKHHRRNIVPLNPYCYEQEVPFRVAA